MNKFYKANNDIMFKAIFCKEENRGLLKRLLEETLKENIEIISVNVPELVRKNIYEKGKTLDVLVKSNGVEINIEVNTYYNLELHRRNASYIFKRYSELTRVGNSYQSMPRVIQINLTSEKNDKLPMVSIYEMYDKTNKILYIDNLKIYEFNLPKIKDECYNKTKEYGLLRMLDCNLEELQNIKGDETMDKLKKEIETLNKDEEFVKFMSDEEEARLLKNTFIEIGYKEGINEGKKESNLNIARNMIKDNMPDVIIKKYTGVTDEEIKSLKKDSKTI